MFMLLRINDWNNNIREIHCFTCTHNSLYVCFSLTPFMCVSVGAAEHPSTRLGLCWQVSRGRRSKQRETRISFPDKAPGSVRWRPLPTHCPPALLAAKRDDMRAKQNNPELTKQCCGYVWYACAPTCSGTADWDELPHKANANARQWSTIHWEVQSAVRKSQRYRFDPVWHRRGCSTEWQTVGVSTVCYSFSKMLPKTEERKKCLRSNVLV